MFTQDLKSVNEGATMILDGKPAYQVAAKRGLQKVYVP